MTPYTPRKVSRPIFVPIRGLRYHCRTWGEEGAPKLFLLHGASDISASWQFTVDALRHDWHIIAPDWRGSGLSDWSKSDTYWFLDLVGDLHRLLEHFSPGEPATIIAHSKGGNVTGTYAGLKPERVRKFVNVEGFVVGSVDPGHPHRRLNRWLDHLEGLTHERRFADYQTFADRIRQANPRLSEERALFLAHEWCEELAEGGVRQRTDPAQKRGSFYSLPEGLECWRRITAPVLWIEGGRSRHVERTHKLGDYETRKAAFQRLSVVRFEEAAHNVHLDEPERLAEASEAFLLQT